MMNPAVREDEVNLVSDESQENYYSNPPQYEDIESGDSPNILKFPPKIEDQKIEPKEASSLKCGRIFLTTILVPQRRNGNIRSNGLWQWTKVFITYSILILIFSMCTYFAIWYYIQPSDLIDNNIIENTIHDTISLNSNSNEVKPSNKLNFNDDNQILLIIPKFDDITNYTIHIKLQTHTTEIDDDKECNKLKYDDVIESDNLIKFCRVDYQNLIDFPVNTFYANKDFQNINDLNKIFLNMPLNPSVDDLMKFFNDDVNFFKK